MNAKQVEIVRALRAGVQPKEVAQRLGVSRAWVSITWRKYYGATYLEWTGRPRGRELSKRISKGINLIATTNVTARAVADQVGCKHVSLCNAFKRRYGCTITEWKAERKKDQARELRELARKVAA
ncbi:MAG: helix-turn-helix domain-containing protein [Pseudomonadota bacterium]